MSDDALAGRSLQEVYRVSGRQDLHQFLIEAVEASGGRVIYQSPATRAPVYLGVQLPSDERLGLLVYPFRVNDVRIKNRPNDEVRGQLRYGSEESWQRQHPVSRDVAGVDVTLIVGIHANAGVMIGLDANLWDPLPMGISFYAKQADVAAATETSWHVWEKTTHGGTKRTEARSESGLETLVAFTPERFIDYARLERRATALHLDAALRYKAALEMATRGASDADPHHHVLEEQFDLTSEQILDIISGRNRLAVAVRGGVAEYHLEQHLLSARGVASATRLDVDAMHDFDVTMCDGRTLRVECKNASPQRRADGSFKVEVQKTRASKNDPTSRFYSVDAFDVVAACLYSPTGKWTFKFGLTSRMATHAAFDGRLAPVQTITDEWVDSLDLLPAL